METSTIIWIIVGIIVVIAIVVIVMLVTRRRRHEAHLEAERKKAAELRQNAYESDVARREREADAAAAAAAAKQAEADAMAAKLESERLARESAAHQADAQQLRTETDERLRKADAVDPDVVTDESAAAARDPAMRTPPAPTASRRATSASRSTIAPWPTTSVPTSTTSTPPHATRRPPSTTRRPPCARSRPRHATTERSPTASPPWTRPGTFATPTPVAASSPAERAGDGAIRHPPSSFPRLSRATSPRPSAR